MKNTLDEIKLKSIVKQLHSTDTNVLAKTLANMIMMLDDEEIKYIKPELLKIDTQHKLELFFVAGCIDDLRSSIKTTNELEELFKDMFEMKRKEFTLDDLDALKNIDFKKMYEDFEKDKSIKFAKGLVKEINDKEYDLAKIINYLLCGLNEEELAFIGLAITSLLKLEESSSITKEEIVDKLSEEDKNKILKGSAKVKEAKFDVKKLPKHLRDEFEELVRTSYDKNSGTLKINVAKVSKELLSFLDKHSKDVLK